MNNLSVYFRYLVQVGALFYHAYLLCYLINCVGIALDFCYGMIDSWMGNGIKWSFIKYTAHWIKTGLLAATIYAPANAFKVKLDRRWKCLVEITFFLEKGALRKCVSIKIIYTCVGCPWRWII